MENDSRQGVSACIGIVERLGVSWRVGVRGAPKADCGSGGERKGTLRGDAGFGGGGGRVGPPKEGPRDRGARELADEGEEKEGEREGEAREGEREGEARVAARVGEARVGEARGGVAREAEVREGELA